MFGSGLFGKGTRSLTGLSGKNSLAVGKALTSGLIGGAMGAGAAAAMDKDKGTGFMLGAGLMAAGKFGRVKLGGGSAEVIEKLDKMTPAKFTSKFNSADKITSKARNWMTSDARKLKGFLGYNGEKASNEWVGKQFAKLGKSGQRLTMQALSGVRGGAAAGAVAGAGYGLFSDRESMISGAMKGAMVGAAAGAAYRARGGTFGRGTRKVSNVGMTNQALPGTKILGAEKGAANTTIHVPPAPFSNPFMSKMQSPHKVANAMANGSKSLLTSDHFKYIDDVQNSASYKAMSTPGFRRTASQILEAKAFNQKYF